MKSALGMGIGFALEALMPLVRLIVLARLLPQDEFGIAVTVLVTLGIVEMCTDMGLVQSAVRGSDTVPNKPFMGTLHSLALMRSVVMALLALSAISIQRVTLGGSIGLDMIVIGMSVMMMRAFDNLHLKKLTREYNFWREATMIGGAQVVWTVVTIGSALLFPSAASLLHGMLAAAVWVVAFSNAMAPDRWQASWNREAAVEAVRYGAPLSPNGIASAVVASDRLIVSNFLGPLQVAVYGVAIGLATLPRAILWRFSVDRKSVV